MKRETIEFHDVYETSEIVPYLPVNAELKYNISVSTYGYVHDVGTIVTLTPNYEGYGKGWSTWKDKLAKAVQEVRETWRINEEFGYH